VSGLILVLLVQSSSHVLIFNSIAKDQHWFKECYFPMKSINSYVTDKSSYVNDISVGPDYPVEGWGIVDISTVCPTKSPNPIGTLRLIEVLHVPTASCNIINPNLLEDVKIKDLYHGSSISIRPLSDSHHIAYFERVDAPDGSGKTLLQFILNLAMPPSSSQFGDSPFGP
jgi:hypothetical protein